MKRYFSALSLTAVLFLSACLASVDAWAKPKLGAADPDWGRHQAIYRAAEANMELGRLARDPGVVRTRTDGPAHMNELRRADLERLFPGLLAVVLVIAGLKLLLS